MGISKSREKFEIHTPHRKYIKEKEEQEGYRRERECMSSLSVKEDYNQYSVVLPYVVKEWSY